MIMKEKQHVINRRHFVRTLALGTGGLMYLGHFGVVFGAFGEDKKTIRGIVVDFTKCTGCRTCETVCSAFNNKIEIDGEWVNGLGNPSLSNIRVHWFNPDVDVPMVCSLCADSPCISSCPVEPDPVTERRALYRNELLGTVHNDRERCIGCGSCARTCKELRTGVIRQDEDGKPQGICHLCNGDPKCVKYCSFGALAFVELTNEYEFRGLSPKEIARKLIWKFYEIEV